MYEERPVWILDRRIKQQCNKQIPLVKVFWENHTSSEATWENEEEKKAKYPHLFEVTLHTLTRPRSFGDKTL